MVEIIKLAPVTMVWVVVAIPVTPINLVAAVIAGKTVLLITALVPPEKVVALKNARPMELLARKIGNVAPVTVPAAFAKEKQLPIILAPTGVIKAILLARLTQIALQLAKMGFAALIIAIKRFVVIEMASALRVSKEVAKI